MNNWLKKVYTKLLTIFVLAASLAIIGACTMPTGSAKSTDSTYEDDLSLFIQDVEDITPIPADPSAADIYTYAITVTEGFSSTETTIADNYPFKSSDGDIVVGTQIPGNSWRFDGVMSDIKIYNRYMEQFEVLYNYSG